MKDRGKERVKRENGKERRERGRKKAEEEGEMKDERKRRRGEGGNHRAGLSVSLSGKQRGATSQKLLVYPEVL